MNQSKILAPVAIRMGDSISAFKHNADSMLSKRSYFISAVLPKLEEGLDFYTIKGRKSLGKSGAEKISEIYNLVATFERDSSVIEMLDEIKGLVAFVCVLRRGDKIFGEGRGADTLSRNGNDPNKTIKMAQKRAYVDAIVRSAGLSAIFSQDLEDMKLSDVKEKENNSASFIQFAEEAEQEKPYEPEAITERQKSFLTELIFQKIDDEEERERRLKEVACMTKADAHENISSLLNVEPIIN